VSVPSEPNRFPRVVSQQRNGGDTMPILLWLLGVPLSLVIVLALLGVI
jgi:hypothetical protein